MTIAPLRRGTIRHATARQNRNTPWVLTAKTSIQSASDNRSTGPIRRIPATLTKTPIGPRSVSTRSTTSSTAAPSRTSTGYARAGHPWPVSAPARWHAPAAFTSTSAIVAPSSARSPGHRRTDALGRTGNEGDPPRHITTAPLRCHIAAATSARSAS